MPFKKLFFRPKGRGPIEKRVAPSDSSKNFGLGGMSAKFFYRYCIACKIRTLLWQKMTIFQFLEPGRQKDRFFTGYTITIKKFR